MKKIVIFLLITVIILSIFTGCTGSDKVSFQANITQVSEGSILVVPVSGSGELNSSDKFSVHITDKTKLKDESGKKCDISALKQNMTVKITYNGMIMESYPAQINADSIQIISQ